MPAAPWCNVWEVLLSDISLLWLVTYLKAADTVKFHDWFTGEEQIGHWICNNVHFGNNLVC